MFSLMRTDAILMIVAGCLALTAAIISARRGSLNYFYLGIGLALVIAGVARLRKRGRRP